MNGGIYICEGCGYSIGHFSSEEDKRLACINCEGWMYLAADDMSHDDYKKPNIIWVGIAHVIWFFLKPISNWLDKHDGDDDDC